VRASVFEIDQTNNLVVVRTDAARLTGDQVQEACGELLQRMRFHNASYIVWDLQGVEFVASDCLGALVSLLQEVEHVRGRIALARCRPAVANLVKITRLDAVFNLYDDLDEAMAEVVSG
jgi:anti-sigma B factor antagonist